MTRRARRWDVMTLIGAPAALLIFVSAQLLEGGSVRSLWQPTAALVVIGGSLAAVMVSYSRALLGRTLLELFHTFVEPEESLEPLFDSLMEFAHKARRRGLIALEGEVAHAPDPFVRGALTLAIDGTDPASVRHILEIESRSIQEATEAPADVLETAAGFAPTLGILGAVLGLIHVMESLSEPSKLGAGIAVAFVATIYGVAVANLLMLPMATKLRGRARHTALCRELVIEGVVAMQQGLHPRIIEQKLSGYLASTRSPRDRRVA